MTATSSIKSPTICSSSAETARSANSPAPTPTTPLGNATTKRRNRLPSPRRKPRARHPEAGAGEIRKSGTAPAKTGAARKAHLPGKTGDGASRSRNTGIRTEESCNRRKTLVRRPAVRRFTALSEQITALMDQIDTKKHAMAGIERDRRLIPSCIHSETSE